METFADVTIPQQFHQSHDTEIDFIRQQNCSTENRSVEDNDNYSDEEDSLQMLRGSLEELDLKGHQVFEKLLSKVEKINVPIERRLRETLHDFRGRKASDMPEKFAGISNGGGVEENMYKDRDVDVDILNLERFKVKTVNIIGSGVMEEEEQ